MPQSAADKLTYTYHPTQAAYRQSQLGCSHACEALPDPQSDKQAEMLTQTDTTP